MDNDFAYIPNTGPPRIIRFAPQDTFDGPWVALFVKKDNLLVVNEDAYRTMSREQQMALFKTRDAYTYIETHTV